MVVQEGGMLLPQAVFLTNDLSSSRSPLTSDPMRIMASGGSVHGGSEHNCEPRWAGPHR